MRPGPVPAGCSATPSGTATPGASGAASRWAGARVPRCGRGLARVAGRGRLWQHPALRALTVLLTFFIFATYGLPDVLIYYLKHGLGQGDGVVGLVLAIAALGTVAGALLVAPLRRRLGCGPFAGAVVLCGIAVAGLGASGSVLAVAVLAAFYLGCISVAGISSMSLRQEVTPDYLLGRVTAAFWTIHFSLRQAGAALLTWAAGHFGVLAACVASGAACLVIGTIALATPVWRPSRNPVRPLPRSDRGVPHQAPSRPVLLAVAGLAAEGPLDAVPALEEQPEQRQSRRIGLGDVGVGELHRVLRDLGQRIGVRGEPLGHVPAPVPPHVADHVEVPGRVGASSPASSRRRTR